MTLIGTPAYASAEVEGLYSPSLIVYGNGIRYMASCLSHIPYFPPLPHPRYSHNFSPWHHRFIHCRYQFIATSVRVWNPCILTFLLFQIDLQLNYLAIFVLSSVFSRAVYYVYVAARLGLPSHPVLVVSRGAQVNRCQVRMGNKKYK